MTIILMGLAGVLVICLWALCEALASHGGQKRRKKP